MAPQPPPPLRSIWLLLAAALLLVLPWGASTQRTAGSLCTGCQIAQSHAPEQQVPSIAPPTPRAASPVLRESVDWDTQEAPRALGVAPRHTWSWLNASSLGLEPSSLLLAGLDLALAPRSRHIVGQLPAPVRPGSHPHSPRAPPVA